MVSLVPVLFFGFYAYRVYTNSIRSKVSEYASQSTKLLNKNLQLELERYSFYIDSLSVLDVIQQLVSVSPNQNVTLTQEQIRKIEQTIENTALRELYLRDIQIVDRNGAILYDSGYESSASSQYKSLLADIDRVSPNDSLQYASSSHTIGNLVLGRKIYRYGTSQEPAGYILVYINAQLLRDKIFGGINFGPDSAVFLMSSNGTVLASSDNRWQGISFAEKPLYAKLMESRSADSDNFTINMDPGQYLAVYDYSSFYDCYFIATVPNSHIQNETKQITTNLIVIAAALFAISFAFTLLVYGSIMTPIKHIISRCTLVSDADLDTDIGDTSPDEIGFLARTIDNLIHEIKAMAFQWQKDQMRKRELELESLRYQINPHFLFNTLNTLKWVATLNEVPVLYEGIESLSILLQKTLIKNEEFVSLEEELDTLSHYFSIQKIRYANCFDVTYSIDENLKSYPVPRFILQPLAENAIIHGTDDSGRIVQITISGRTLDNGDILITVKDDGKGFQTCSSTPSQERFSGIGLSNVNERLRLYYGAGYELEIQSRPGKGTCCRIRLPRDKTGKGKDVSLDVSNPAG